MEIYLHVLGHESEQFVCDGWSSLGGADFGPCTFQASRFGCGIVMQAFLGSLDGYLVDRTRVCVRSVH